jgi:uncharacterized protein (TIGR02284 family)
MSQDFRKDDIDQLNSFLRGEISAVETYKQALPKVDHPTAQSILRNNLSSHESRVHSLRSAIQRLGGKPAEGSGPWGALAKAIEGGAKLFGESTAVAALEEGEDHGMKDYQSDVDKLSPGARQMIAGTLLPEQRKTHDSLARLKQIMD